MTMRASLALIVVAFAGLCRPREADFGYEVIEQTGKFCPGRDSCKPDRSSRGPDGVEQDWKKRNCFCDNDCSFYGDCCIDANAYKRSEQEVNHQRFECVNLKQYGDIYVRNKCNSDWALPSVKIACEEPKPSDLDPFATTPVTSASSGFTYKNFNCAVCNNDSSDIRFWRPRLECPTLTSYDNRFHNLTSAFIEANLVSNEDGRWGVNLDTSGVKVFHECTVDPSVPDELTHFIRACSGKSTVTSCPREYNAVNETIVELCGAYTGMVFEPNAAYRNVHCAICNKANLEQLICLNLGPFGRFNWQQNFNSFSFAVLFDISGDIADKVGYKRCPEGEMFDPFFKKCRNVICGQEGLQFREGRCISTQVETTTEIHMADHEYEEEDTTTTHQNDLDLLLTTTWIPFAATEETTTRFAFTTTTTTIAAKTTTARTTTTRTTTTTTQTSTTSAMTTTTAEFSDCPKFELQVGEFEMMDEEHSVYVEKYDRVLKEGQYSMNGETLVICVVANNNDDFGSEEQALKFGPQMGYVTFACLGISVVCLSLHIIATCISPELQNLSGKNLLSLSLALLGSYLAFITAMFTTDMAGSALCSALAVAMYFFFMASFFWMMVIAFDVGRTLKMATSQLRLNTGCQWRKFFLYSTFGWGMPIACATVAAFMDQMEEIPRQFKPGFGLTDLCWFSNKMALLIYFAVPFAGIMGVNIFLFLYSACMIYDTTKSTQKTTLCGPRTNFHLYLRLAVIMGLAWITGLAAGFVNKEPVWYVFIALNTLQGLFIFVAFTCTKKITTSVRDALCGGAGNRSHRSSPWKWSRDGSSNATKKSNLSSDLSPASPVVAISAVHNSPEVSPSLVPSRYGPRSTTMYTVSRQQVSGVTQNSFDGRYF